MKRCFIWVANRFTNWVHETEIEEKMAFFFKAMVSIFAGAIFFVCIDKSPATSSDYEPLERQMEAIEQNPSLLLKAKCKISINDDVLIATFSNDECNLTVRYDENFRVLSTCKKDNCIFWPWALVISVLISTIIYLVFSIMFLKY